ncbi:MAG TPA: porin [Methylibium sp.]|uniref:porin n=1 Tax=Methylibium sp. TaxID=2067992 RepID=UPI002DC01399|nr:porin [Methylibium sp.]HEU4458581.1 porin [Methylibium sp.]
MTTKTKLSLVAVAALTAAAGAAQAQNVTLFGRIDTGVQYIEKSSRSATGDSLTEMNNGGILPSIWGLKGSEDLGGGLKAVFNLESDFSGDTGGSRGLGNISTAFGRQANVGLSGGFGTILLGRQYSPAILAELGVDPRGYKESYSMLLPYALNQAPAGNAVAASENNGLGIFTSNLISYAGAFGPVNVFAGYGLGEVASSSDADTVAFGANGKFGPVTVAGSFQRIRGGATSGFAKTERYGLGAAFGFGIVTVKGLYARATEDAISGLSAAEIETDNFGVGVDLAWLANNTATIAYYRGETKSTNFETDTIVVSNDYALSKRTTLYAQFVYVDDKSPVVVGASNARNQITGGSTQAGEKSFIAGVGIKHDF